MDNNIDSNRILHLRKELRITQGEFASRLGFSQANLSAIESGKTPLTESNVNLICLTFDVNKDWLTTGDGEMFTNTAMADEQWRNLFENFKKLSKQGQSSIVAVAEKMAEFESSVLSAQK